jgi:hypothetical protein
MVFHTNISSDLSLSHVGPALGSALPALFYFALSAEDSLSLDPYDQPVRFLNQENLRIFSMTLPGHGPHLDPTKALVFWAEQIQKGENLIAEFVEKVSTAVDFLVRKEIALPGKLAVAGLSRGAFIATHAAAAIPSFHYLLGFAPLTKLSYAKEFQELRHSPLVTSLDLTHKVASLTHCKVRYYIGNHDTRVGTAHAFELVDALSKTAYAHRIRSPQVELIIGPSIGHQGHGTGPAVFKDGAHWISKHLGSGQ